MCIRDLFHILLSLWHTNGSMECGHICMYKCRQKVDSAAIEWTMKDASCNNTKVRILAHNFGISKVLQVIIWWSYKNKRPILNLSTQPGRWKNYFQCHTGFELVEYFKQAAKLYYSDTGRELWMLPLVMTRKMVWLFVRFG